MRSPSTTDAQRLGAHYSLLIVWLCCMIVFLGATSASAQTPVNPTTDTILFSGPGPEGRNTGPLGGIIIQGTAISAFTGQPVRHLWVADTFSSICRMDPELDAPGPWNMNATTCTFKVTVDDRTHTFNGRLVGEGLELSSEDIEKPVTLQRVKSPA